MPPGPDEGVGGHDAHSSGSEGDALRSPCRVRGPGLTGGHVGERRCPELDLLLLTTRVHPDPDIVVRIRDLVRSHLDWTALLRLAGRHASTPLLYWTLSAVCQEEVPPGIFQRLREQFEANAASNLRLTSELVRLLAWLEADGVLAIPFKGPVLAAAVYGNLALRAFSDLDVLVRPADVMRAHATLARQGYRPRLDLTGTRAAVAQRRGHEATFTRRDGAVTIELHWDVAPWFFTCPVDLEGMWARREPLELAGRTVSNLAAEDLLLVLCIHGSKHLWARLQWIADTAELVRVRPGVDWDRVHDHARRSGSLRMLRLGLRLAGDLLGTRLPGGMDREIGRDSATAALAAQVVGRLLEEPFKRATGFDELRFHLRSRERLRDRIRYCLRLPVTPSERDWAGTPGSITWLPALARRPLRLLRERGRRGPG
jgi:Uncharacterised nucleotidyltransferase